MWCVSVGVLIFASGFGHQVWGGCVGLTVLVCVGGV